MAKNKTTETEASVADYVAAIADEKRREDFSKIVALMSEHSGSEPKMWGAGIVGFGSYSYKYDSGHSGTAPLVGASSRADSISLYLSYNFERREELLAKFGKHKTGKACIYVKKLEDIDTGVLAEMVRNAVAHMKAMYPDHRS